MAHPLDDTRPLPFAPGESPFHIKGIVYRGHLEWIAENSPGGIAGMNRAFRDERLAPFLAQRFLPSSWYDIVPIITSAYVVARLRQLPFADFLRHRTRIQAKSDLGGIYRLLLKFTSPSDVVSRYAAVQAQYFDFGVASARLVAPKQAELERSQVPAMFFEWFIPVQEAFLEVAVASAGAKRLKVTTLSASADGQLRGVDTVKLITDVTWE